jgi:hypothetical protein
MVKMRIDIKTVKGKEYLQYVDPHGHVYHIGPANKLESWQLAFWLYGCGLESLKFQFYEKMQLEFKERFGLDQEKWERLMVCLNDGKNGEVSNFPEGTIDKIYDKKAMECDELRKAIKQKFPHITGKEEMRRTVNYNRRRAC